ncbi:MAG: NUDIX hydrolase [Sphingomonadales bacterium]
MTRQYPDRPIFGVGAIIFEGDKVLLIKRGSPPLEGYWSLPGGAQETGETVEAAVIREILEETGLEIKIINFSTMVDIIDLDDAGKARHHFTVADYICRVTGGELQAGGDAAKVAWVPMADLDTLNLTPKAREVIEAAWQN